MSPNLRLVSAGIAAAALAVVVAACGTTQNAVSGSATTSDQATSASSAPATSSAPAATPTPAPTRTHRSAPETQSSSSPVAQANASFPYEPGGVTYSGDEGAVELFSIPAGKYSVNQQYAYTPANDPDGSGQCLFGGDLDWLSGEGGTVPLGDNGYPVTAGVPINGPPVEVPLPAGDYRLYIFPTTTCSWTIAIWPDS